MTPGEAIGWVLIIAAAVAVLPELVAPRPVFGVVFWGVLFGIAGGVLIADHRKLGGGQ